MPQFYDWESVKETLAELYLTDGLPLKDVMDIMKIRQGMKSKSETLILF